MNTDQLKGKLQDAVGHVKQGIGEALGSDKTANEGVSDQVKGSAREVWGNAKDAAATSSDGDRDVAADDTGSSTRDAFSEKLHDVKGAINEKIDEYKSTHNS